MESENLGTPAKEAAKEEVKARLRQRRQAAEATARDLGLPEAAAPTVLRAMREPPTEQRTNGAGKEEAPVQPAAPRPSER